jgi:hypothetical protein
MCRFGDEPFSATYDHRICTSLGDGVAMSATFSLLSHTPANQLAVRRIRDAQREKYARFQGRLSTICSVSEFRTCMLPRLARLSQ